MPHFKLNITQAGPVLDMLVFVSEARRGALVALGQPVPATKAIRMLVDTGASHTCLDPTVFRDLQLTPTGSTEMLTPSTGSVAFTADTYDVGLAMGSKPGEMPFYLPTWKVSSSELFDGQGIHGLLGRDILARCILNYNGATAEFTIAY